eukprot:1137684-Prorocentrum_minimum.AAC.2
MKLASKKPSGKGSVAHNRCERVPAGTQQVRESTSRHTAGERPRLSVVARSRCSQCPFFGRAQVDINMSGGEDDFEDYAFASAEVGVDLMWAPEERALRIARARRQ